MLNHNVAWRSTFFRAFGFGRELVDRGHRVTLVTISPKSRVSFSEKGVEGVRVVESPDLGVGLARTGWDPYDALRRLSRSLREGYDVVHGFDCRPVVLVPSLVHRALGAPWVSDWADWWGRGGAISERKSWVGRVAFAPFETFLEEQFRRFASQVTVTSRALRDRALGLGLREDRVHYIPSGHNVRSIVPQDQRRCRAELGLDPEVPVACFVGFVQYDLELVVRSFARARTQVRGAKLVLAGPPNAECRALVQQLGLGEAVLDLGLQPFERMATVMGSADLLLLPVSDNLMNRARGPIKLGDYMAAGRALLSNPVGDLVDVFEADEVGELAAASVESYGDALGRLLSDRARLERFGRTARTAAETKWAWRAYAPQLEAVYDRAIAGF
jgi:glycosyltransferase involved in cell wall biosynthesis